MNNKGQSMGMAILSAIFIFIVGMIAVNFLMPEISLARGNLSCASPTEISSGVMLLCLMLDGAIPYWIITIFSVALGAIIARFTL
jgi:hypothetical protein